MPAFAGKTIMKDASQGPLATRIKTIWNKQGWKENEFSDKGISERTVRKICNTGYVPTDRTLGKLAKLLEMKQVDLTFDILQSLAQQQATWNKESGSTPQGEEASAGRTPRTGVGHTPNECLPIETWPHFQWKLEGSLRKPLPAKVYGLNRTSLCMEFEAKRGLWLPGSAFPDYVRFREQTWTKRQEHRQREGHKAESDDHIWHVERIALLSAHGEPRSLRLAVQRACYSDVVATAQDPALNSPVGNTTVQKRLASHWKPGDPSLPFYPAANQLMVVLMVTTKDNRVLVARQGISGAGAKGKWANSVVGHVHGYDDNDDLERPDPVRTASREAIEEVGVPVKAMDVQWMALVVGLRLGSFSLHGEVRCDLSSQEIISSYFPKRTKPEEISDWAFVELTPAAVAQRLEIMDYTNYFELGFALLLWRRGLSKIVYPPRSDRWAYME